MDFVARYALLKPPSTETLASRLTQAGVDEAAAKDIAAKAEGETAGDEVFGCIVVNDELDAAVEAVDDFVYEPGEGEGEETEEGDETMEDADAGAEAADAANGEENEEATEAA
jgi:guanylate kinase